MNLGIEPTIISLLPRDLVVTFGHVESSLGRELLFHHADKVLVVSDNYQLEIGLGGTRRDDLGQCNRQTSFVFVIKIGSGLNDSSKKKGSVEYVGESKSLYGERSCLPRPMPIHHSSSRTFRQGLDE